MEQTVFIVIVGVFIIMSLFGFMVDYLEYKAKERPLPENVKDVYDTEAYEQWKVYTKEYARLKLIKDVPLFIATFLMLVLGGFTALAAWSAAIGGPYVTTLAFIGILYGVMFFYNLPFRIYQTFSIEARYGFNKTTPKLFIKDRLIGLILSVVFGGGIILLLQFFFLRFETLFLVFAFLAIMLILFLINIAYVKVILPLFNTLTPLEDGALKENIETLATKENYTVQKIHTMDASKRSTKLNAFFSGFGRFKNVVLFDTLLDKMDDEAILAVLAHEIGHAKHKDSIKNLFISAMQFLIILGVLYLFLTQTIFYEAFGLTETHFAFALVIFSLVFEPVMLLIGIVTNKLSRIAEFKADAFAKQRVSDNAMTRALKILAKENFSTLTPHPLSVLLYYSHPPISRRIEAIQP